MEADEDSHRLEPPGVCRALNTLSFSEEPLPSRTITSNPLTNEPGNPLPRILGACPEAGDCLFTRAEH